MGRLLEDMDMFAVHLVFKHMTVDLEDDSGNPQLSPFSIVTALCKTFTQPKTPKTVRYLTFWVSILMLVYCIVYLSDQNRT